MKTTIQCAEVAITYLIELAGDLYFINVSFVGKLNGAQAKWDADNAFAIVHAGKPLVSKSAGSLWTCSACSAAVPQQVKDPPTTGVSRPPPRRPLVRLPTQCPLKYDHGAWCKAWRLADTRPRCASLRCTVSCCVQQLRV
jgi:hypothetical protein